MTGPLAACEGVVRAGFAQGGYAAASLPDAVSMLGWLSRWLEEKGLSAAELTPALVEEFVAGRRRVCRTEAAARRSLGAVLRVLRGCGVVPAGVDRHRQAAGPLPSPDTLLAFLDTL
jgi:hypothetical protein